jgi:predicted dehydrogenase
MRRGLGIAVVGVGRWGPNLVRNFSVLDECTVRWVCDVDAERARRVSSSTGARATSSLGEVLADDEVEAVAIATPAASHRALVHECLDSGRHLFVEKPLTTTLADAVAFADVAARRGLVLVCDHTYCFSATVRRLRTLVRGDGLGELRRIESTRVNRGQPQPDVDVFWDLAHHDLAILDFLLPPGQRPTAVSACGSDPMGIGRACAGELTLDLDGKATAHVRLDWLGQAKVRTMRFEGSRGAASWDDLAEPLRLKLDSGRDIAVDNGFEPLHGAVRDFVAAILETRAPTIGVAAELRVLQMLEATRRSQERGGVPVPLLLEGVP